MDLKIAVFVKRMPRESHEVARNTAKHGFTVRPWKGTDRSQTLLHGREQPFSMIQSEPLDATPTPTCLPPRRAEAGFEPARSKGIRQTRCERRARGITW